MHLQHNGQPMLLLPNSQVIVNPRDSLQLINVETDGWLSFGTKLVSAEVDVKAMTRKTGAVISELFPNESFEKAIPVELKVMLWNRPIGKVSLLVQLDYKDWLHRANSSPDSAKESNTLRMR